MDNFSLPKKLEIGGRYYRIRTDYRAILDILKACNDCELSKEEKTQVMIEILYLDYYRIPHKYLEEACEKAVEFIDCGIKDDKRPKPRLMDWGQDSPVIIPAINKTIGREVRALKYMHWWTFMAAYMETGECLFQQIIHIRQKKAKGKKLEKWEEDFYKSNKSLVDFQTNDNKRSDEETDALRELFGFK